MSTHCRFVLLLTILILTLIFSANALADPVIVSGGPANDYESWIARLSDGRIMVVFCRNPDWTSGDLYVTFSEDNGVTWSQPQVIIEAAGDQATLSFVQMPSDSIRLYYASNQAGAYKIYMVSSLDGLEWTESEPLDLGWGNGITHYDPTVILEPDSSLTMSYVVSGQGVYITHCSYSGNWDTEMTQVYPSGYRARVMKHPSGTYLYAYHSRTGGQYEYDVFVRTSSDRVSWSTPIQITTNHNSHDPFVCQMYDGSYMVSYAKHTGIAYNLYCRFSADAVNWGEEYVITEDYTNNTQPHIWPEGGDLYLSYAHAVNYPDDHDVYLEVLDYSTAIDDNKNIAESFDLSFGCFPNPFNGATRINFTLDKASRATIDIYDLLGRQVERLYDSYCQPGSHSLFWEASSFSSGVYFARLTISDKAGNIKMLLIK